ncbi:hypothetical protein C8F01DRAFT_1116143 [Mycena amicta]|nr:hypothetical protein C8F01DRAFT_1116143 [Mycena amicta]
MTDLTFCCLHMSSSELQVLDTIGTSDYLIGDTIPDDLNIPAHLVPPDPDDSNVLPSRVHPSYPYGDPTNRKHPTATPRPLYDPSSHALFEDMGYGGGLNINGAHRWHDLALETLLPVDPVKEQAQRAAAARKLTGGASNTPQARTGEEHDSREEGEDDEQDEEGDEDLEEEGEILHF